ncbi:uncharacterized protein LOC141849551 [Brevipalpus obovatus]|uniref:uncharacterized protein LOC141849551 n=1 Tax=Brevipalpus obovatus TaxID=246614 RepID=UPI003D9F46A6
MLTSWGGIHYYIKKETKQPSNYKMDIDSLKFRALDDDFPVPKQCDNCTCSKCPAKCDDCPKCDVPMTTLADLRQASTKMVPAENDVVADGAIDLPENGVFPQTDSLIQKLEDIMKRINTVCLKDCTSHGIQKRPR